MHALESQTRTPQSGTDFALPRALAWSVFGIALSVFIFRGPVRGVTGSNDLAMVYSSARVWFQGGDPYDFSSFRDALASAGSAGRSAVAGWTAESAISLYPPSTYIMMSPLGALPWGLARVVWVLVNVVATVWLLVLCARWSGLCLGSTRGVVFLAAGLMLAPLHTGISLGQVSLVPVVLGVWACSVSGSRPLLAGAALGLGLAIKPQLAVACWLWLLAMGRWRAAAGSAGLAAAVLGLGAAWLSWHVPGWWQGLLRNISDFGGVGGLCDPSDANPVRYQLINLAQPLYSVFGVLSVARIVSLCIALVLIAMAHTAVRRRPDDHAVHGWALTSFFLAAVSVGYHRPYDAVFLVLPLSLALGSTPVRWCVLAVYLVFIAPGGSFLHHVAAQFGFLDRVSGTWWWEDVLLSNHAWSLFVLCGVLVRELFRAVSCRSGAGLEVRA